MARYGFGFGTNRRRMTSGTISAPPSSLIALGTPVCMVGDSMSYAEGDHWPSGYITRLMLEADGAFHYPATTNMGTGDGSTTSGGNMAIKGQNAAGYAARKATIAAAVGTGVLLIGGIQNVGGTVTEKWGSILEVIEACADTRAIFITPAAPTKDVVGGSLDKPTFDGLASAYAAANTSPSKPIVFLSDTWNGITLATDAVSGGPHAYDTPGVHQNPLGSALQAANMWGQMAAYWESGNAYDALADLITAGGDYIEEVSLDGSTGGLATSWSNVNPSGATITPTKGTLLGYTSQIVTVSGSATSNGLCSLRRNSIPLVFSAGESIGGAIAIKVSNAAQDGPAVGLRSLGAHSYFLKSGWASSSFNPTGGQGYIKEEAANFSGIVRFRPPDLAQISGGGTTLNFDLYYTLLTDAQLSSAGFGSLDVRIEIARPIMANWTQLGIE